MQVHRRAHFAAGAIAAFGVLFTPLATRAQEEGTGRAMAMPDTTGVVWRMPPLRRPMPMMLPSLMGTEPPVTPFLPGTDIDSATLPEAVFFQIVEMAGGDTLRLEAGFVRRRIGARTFTMYGTRSICPRRYTGTACDSTTGTTACPA